MSKPLLPCPFCGSLRLHRGYEMVGQGESAPRIKCLDCGASMTAKSYLEEHIATRWNSRSASPEKKEGTVKLYLVALCSGGVMEHPQRSYSDYDTIEALDSAEAKQRYDRKHHCSYFYGETLGEIVDGKVILPLSFFPLKK